MKRMTQLPLLALLLLIVLTGCIVPPAEGTATAPEASVTHEIEHAMGTTTITGTPQRVVALEWKYAEDLLAIGLQPVGVADIAGYNEWVKIPVALSPDVVDVGTRQAPNLELIASLQPDLILTGANRVGESYEQLSAIAPTLVFTPYPSDETVSPYQEMRDVLTLIAEVTDRQAEGEAALARLDEKFAEARATLESAGLLGEKFILAQGFTSDNAATVRLFIENAMAIQIIEQTGLELGWNSGWQQYGFSTVSVEELPQLGDLHFFYVVQDDDNIFASEAVKPLWEQLEFVKNGHAYPLGGGTWLFGGSLSAEVLIEIVVKALVPEAAVAQ